MSYSAEVLADSPLAYYRLGEASGTTMIDSSGNSRNGAYAGAATLGATGLVAGDADTAASFPGATTARGETAHAAWMDVSAVTVEAVIKPDVFSANRSIADRDGAGDRIWQFRITPSGQLQALVWNASASLATFTASTTLTVGSEHHVVMTYDGSTVKLFQDGTEVASGARSGGLRVGPAPLTVGVGHGGGSADQYFQPFDGVIDEVAIYGSALSAARIAVHADVALNGPPANPAGTLAATLPTPAADLSGTYAPAPIPGALAPTLPVPSVALSGFYVEPGMLAAGAVSASLPMPTVAFTGTYADPVGDGGQLAAMLPAPTFTFAGKFYPRIGYGMVLDSTTTVDAEAPLPATPSDTGTPALVLHVITPTVPTPVLVNGRPS